MKRVKRFLSLILALLLITSTLSPVTASAAETFQASILEVSVKDKAGNPVPNATFDVVDYSQGEESIGTISSDQNGIIKYDVSTLTGGMYYLSMIPTADYISQSPSPFMFMVSDGAVTQANNADYTNTSDLQITLIGKGGGSTTPSTGDPKTLKISVQTETGVPVSDCQFAIIDDEFPTVESMLVTPIDGVLTLNWKSSYPVFGTIRIASASQSSYSAVSEPITFKTMGSAFSSVNDATYDGSQTFTFVVKKSDSTITPPSGDSKPALTGLTVSPDSLASSGGKVTATVTGTNLGTDTSNIELLLKASSTILTTTITPISLTNDQHVYEITIPENTTTNQKVYTLEVNNKKNYLEFYTKTITVAKSEGTGQDPNLPSTPGSLTAISATPETVGKEGGLVTVTPTGTGLTDKNWTVSVETFVKDTDFPITNVKATVESITSEKAILRIPSNSMKNELEYVITAKSGTSSVSTKVYQDAAATTVALTIDMVALIDAQTVQANFTHEIEPAGTLEELKSKITISGYGETGALKEADTVEVKGSSLLIHFAEPFTTSSSVQPTLVIEKEALKRDGVLGKAVNWLITVEPRVTNIRYEQDIFDYNGGTAKATLEGVLLDQVKNITAIIRDPETAATLNITPTVTPGKQPIIEFEVPENTTTKTQTYLLSVKLDNVPVYEATGANHAKRAIVSVLPKGTDTTARTLSALTGSINDTSGSEDLKDLEFVVSPQIGGLKIMLKLAGTNLDASLTEARAIDENGVIWPVTHIAECDGTWRFTSVAGIHKNGVTGDGNSQFIEILPPRYAGTNKTYILQVAIDGVNFIEEHSVRVTIKNEGISSESMFVECSKNTLKDITVKYVDKRTKKELATPDIYKGYPISFYGQFNIQPKEIDGYTVANPDLMDAYNSYFLNSKEQYTFVYEYDKKDTSTLPFVDVPEDGSADWYYSAVEYVYNNGIMTGFNETTFGPTATVNRAQFATILHRFENKPVATNGKAFPDVEKGSWYEAAVLWASESGIVTGYGNGTFGPTNSISRQDMILMLYRYEKNYKGKEVDTSASLASYKDHAKVSGYAKEAMQWAIGAGIISGKYNNTMLDPSGTTTRAEAAIIIQRFLNR